MKVQKNLNLTGRLIRFFAALVFLAYAYIYKSYTAFFVSLFVFFEAGMSWCIVYQILGINRCPVSKKSKK